MRKETVKTTGRRKNRREDKIIQVQEKGNSRMIPVDVYVTVISVLLCTLRASGWWMFVRRSEECRDRR